MKVADAAVEEAMEAAEAITEVAISRTVEEWARIKEEASSTATGISSRFDGGCMCTYVDVLTDYNVQRLNREEREVVMFQDNQEGPTGAKKETNGSR